VEDAVDGIAFMASVEGRQPAIVRLNGELDMAGVPRLRAALAGLEGDVELDCSGLEFIDAAGLRAFQLAHEACAARGCKLALVDPSAVVCRLLAIVEMDTVFLIRETSEAS
jgi:anti-anti-sigma factor